MSVLACYRRGCENIMCDRCSPEHGYICDECFDELVQSGPETRVETFMATDKKNGSKESAFARFDVEFPLRKQWRAT